MIMIVGGDHSDKNWVLEADKEICMILLVTILQIIRPKRNKEKCLL